MMRAINFDDLPIDSAFVSAVKLAAILLGICGALLAVLYAAPGIVLLALGIFAILMLPVVRHARAIFRHTQYRLIDLWFMTSLSGTVFGLIACLFHGPGADEITGSYNARLALSLSMGWLALVLLSRGLYTGIRLAMWLQSERTLQRLGLLSLGTMGYVLHVVRWIALLISFLLQGKIVINNVALGPFAFILPTLAFWLIYFIVTRVHTRHRIQAQRNFELAPDSLGFAGHLVPATGEYGVSRLLGWALGRFGRIFR